MNKTPHDSATTHLKQPTIQWDTSLIKRYDKAGPRYTSYPTAVQFNDGFDSALYQQVMDQASLANPSQHLSPLQDLSLYVHIPFCAHVCYYCACNKVITKRREKAQPYLNRLYREIEMRAQACDSQRQVKQLHWGGGTPTFINLEQMTDLMDTLGRHFNLSASDERDFSIEIDPREVEAETLPHLKSLGFNRISLGVQDFNERVQIAINRVQPFAMTQKVLEQARKHQFRSINIDLIYGLPFQSQESFQQTLDQVIALDPDRLSIFNYAHLPERFMPQRRINAQDLPNSEEKLAMLADSIRILTAAGYQYIGMDHFAKPNDSLAIAQRNSTLHRNFQGYTTHEDCDLIALGVSSISQIGNTYFQNTSDIVEYQCGLDNHELPIQKGIILTDEDVLRRHIIQQLICHFELAIDDVNQKFAIDFFDHFSEELTALKPYEADELLYITNNKIVITGKGRLLIRNICMVFDAYTGQSLHQTRYSKVI